MQKDNAGSEEVVAKALDFKRLGNTVSEPYSILPIILLKR